jgi:hypothetical protein
VLANRLEQTSNDLSKAREQLGVAAPSPTWVDEEPSLDPFTAKPVAAALSSMGIRLDDLPGGKNQKKEIKHFPPKPEESVEQRADAPPFERAPQLAHRIEDPPSFDSGSGSDYGPEPGQHVERMGGRAEVHSGPPFDARSTRPRTKLPEGDRKTLKMNRDAPDPAMVPPKPGKPSFDGKETLPSQSGQTSEAPSQPPRGSKTLTGQGRGGRARVETLKSAGGALLGSLGRGAPGRDGPSSRSSESPGPGQIDAKSTRPDGELRKARDEASGDAKTTIDVGAAGEPEDGFRPTKVTIPLDPPDALKSELDELRKEFKERLRKSREARQRDGRKDSD